MFFFSAAMFDFQGVYIVNLCIVMYVLDTKGSQKVWWVVIWTARGEWVIGYTNGIVSHIYIRKYILFQMDIDGQYWFYPFWNKRNMPVLEDNLKPPTLGVTVICFRKDVHLIVTAALFAS